MTTLVAALLVWFALSVPVTLVIGRIIGGVTPAAKVPSQARRSSASGLVRS